jgi:pyruvyl transferase EpsO
MPTCDHSRLLLRETLRELLPAGTRCGIVLYPDHWNAGDAAIWCGTRQLLRELGVEIAYGCDTTSYDKRALTHALPEGPILIAGGGNFGDVYVPEHALRLQILEDYPGRPVIQLPQSIWFRGTEGVAATAEALRKHANATLLLRDAPSLAFAQRHFSSPARLCPDAAIALDLSTVPRQADVPMVAVWRDDRESADPPPPMPAGSIACDWLLPGGVLPPEQARQMSIAGLGRSSASPAPSAAGWPGGTSHGSGINWLWTAACGAAACSHAAG